MYFESFNYANTTTFKLKWQERVELVSMEEPNRCVGKMGLLGNRKSNGAVLFSYENLSGRENMPKAWVIDKYSKLMKDFDRIRSTWIKMNAFIL